MSRCNERHVALDQLARQLPRCPSLPPPPRARCEGEDAGTHAHAPTRPHPSHPPPPACGPCLSTRRSSPPRDENPPRLSPRARRAWRRHGPSVCVSAGGLAPPVPLRPSSRARRDCARCPLLPPLLLSFFLLPCWRCAFPVDSAPPAGGGLPRPRPARPPAVCRLARQGAAAVPFT